MLARPNQLAFVTPHEYNDSLAPAIFTLSIHGRCIYTVSEIAIKMAFFKPSQ